MSSGGGGSTTTRTELPAELRPLASAYAQKAMQIGNQAYTPYTGQRFAGMNDAQNSVGSFYQQQMGSGTNPYLDQMVKSAQGNLVDQYNSVIRPSQTAMMARSGSFGNSGVQSAMDQQNKTFMGQLSDVATNMYGGQYNADQGRRFQAAQGLFGYGGLQQANAQQPLDFAYQQFQEAQNQPYKNLGAMGAPFGTNMGNSSTSSSNQSRDWLGTAAGLGGLFLLGSDRRIKEDVKKVGKTDGGLNVYTYKYKGSPITHMGVMAQEVKKKIPKAVGLLSGDIMGVDYSQVK